MTILENDFDILDRHQPYVIALDIVQEEEYFELISKFLLDENITAIDADDIEAFINLMVDTPFAKNSSFRVRFGYFAHLLSKIDEGETQYLLPRYCRFVDQFSEWFVLDLYHDLIRDYEPSLIEKVFNLLPTDKKMDFLEIVFRYPAVVEQIPRLKLYCIFS